MCRITLHHCITAALCWSIKVLELHCNPLSAQLTALQRGTFPFAWAGVGVVVLLPAVSRQDNEWDHAQRLQMTKGSSDAISLLSAYLCCISQTSSEGVTKLLK